MKPALAVSRLSALAQPSRLAVFRHLVQAGPGGACPADIVARLGIGGSTLSFHLKALAHAGLIAAEPSGRSIVYRAEFDAMRGLVDYLTENCCGGDAGACVPPAGVAPTARRSTSRR